VLRVNRPARIRDRIAINDRVDADALAVVVTFDRAMVIAFDRDSANSTGMVVEEMVAEVIVADHIVGGRPRRAPKKIIRERDPNLTTILAGPMIRRKPNRRRAKNIRVRAPTKHIRNARPNVNGRAINRRVRNGRNAYPVAFVWPISFVLIPVGV